ncbi:MAG TPA: SdrD B-like domain-containing protein, partial [Kiritimatiellia bacterium]|nr:SdrD B-like domain-containing protein [Kiritimatiellia bacterium]
SLIGQPVNDTDPSHHFGASGAIDIEKATNGQDADTPTGPTVAVGSNVTWTYVVRNTGNIGVTNVVVYDSDIGFITNLVSGDLNNNRVIETNETWTYSASGLAVAGQYANLGSVTGVTVSTGSPVTDTDPSHYFGQTAGYTLVKQVLSPTNRAALVGELITFRLTVQNTGDVTLVTVPLEDRYNLAELSFVSSVPAPTDGLDDGILNWANLGPLTSGSSTSVVVTFVAVGSTEGLNRTNTVIARPTTPPGDQPVPPQTNDAPYRISAPGFALSKTLLAPTNRPAILGESITFRITIANTGDVTLVTVPLRDRYETNYLAFVSAVPPPVNSTNDGVLDWSNLGPLPPGASTSVVATFRAVGLPPSIVRTNTVIASPTTPTNEPPVPPATNDAPYRIAVITIGDTVWIDVNSNGIHDEDLSIFGLNGVRVDLYNIVDGVTNFVDFRLPGPNHGNLGFYQFTNLPVIGTYVAEVVLSFIPPGLPVTTTPLQYKLDTSVVFTNGVVQYADFGFNNQFGTPIELVSFSGRPSPEGIELAWETAWESDTLGFHLYRTSGSGEQDPVRVTDAVIPGEGAEVGAAYRWLDRTSGLEGLLRYWLVEVALNGEEAWYGPVVVYAGELDVEHALASFTQPAGTGELARLTGTTLMQAGVPISQFDLNRLMVEVDGQAVARLISAERVSMLPDDYLLFYLPPSSEPRRIAVRLARAEETVPAMAWVYARPRGGAGDVGVTPVENGRPVLATYQPGLVRMFVPGFVNPAIWILDVTDASMPSLLYGFATVADDQQGAYAVYLSLDSTQDQTLLFVEQDAILDIDSVETGD